MTPRSWRIRRTLVRVLVPLALVSASAITVGCKSGGGPGQAQDADVVGHRTGSAEYDEFFDDVYELKQQLKTVTEDEKRARAPLGNAVGATDSVDDLLRKTLARIDQITQSKGHVRLEMDGIDDQGRPLAGKPITVKSIGRGRGVPKDTAEFATVLEATAKAEAQVWEKYAPLGDKARRMDNRADALVDRLDSEFPKKSKRDEVKRNLLGAKGLLTDLASRADQAVGACTKILKGTADVLIPVIGPGKDRPQKEERAKDRDRERKPAAKAPRAASESSRSASAGKSGAGAAARAGAEPRAQEAEHSASPATPPPPGGSNPPPSGDFNP